MGLILPKNAAPNWRCRVPTGENETCGKAFYDFREMQKHAISCANSHRQEIHEQSPVTKMPFLHDREMFDTEYEEWMLGIGERMEREKRLTKKPGEH